MIKEKKETRRIYKEIRNNLGIDELRLKSERIFNRLIDTNVYAEAEMLFTYVNTGSEVMTYNIIERALADGKRVAVPLMGDEKGKMCFIEIESTDLLANNKYGIPEPPFSADKMAVCSDKTLVVVPLLAFDKNKYRLGCGGGYYDRFISSNKALAYVGLAADVQYANFLPIEEFDEPLDYIITESKIY